MPNKKPKVPEAIAGIIEMNKRMAETFRPFADMQRHIANVVAPHAQIQKQLQGLRFTPPPWLSQIEKAARQFVEIQKNMGACVWKIWREDFNPRCSASNSLSRTLPSLSVSRGCSRMPASCLTPLMPPKLIEECADDPVQLSTSIEKYYQENWPRIEAALSARVDDYAIDDEAKSAFREALALHGAKHFRSVVRLLFPEIERVATTDGSLKRFVNKKRLKPIPLLQELAGRLSLSDVSSAPRIFWDGTFERLTDHLYVSVWTAGETAQMEADAVPNRHAAVHGLVVYRSFKNP